MYQPEIVNCDKCQQLVEPSNNVTNLLAEVEMAVRRELTIAFILHTPKARGRHFMPTANCPGSPSRNQYIEGQPRSENYDYDPHYEVLYRNAYKKLQEKKG